MAFGFNLFDQGFNRSIDDIIVGHVLFQDSFCSCAILVAQWMAFLDEHSELTEFEEDVVKHIGLLACNAFSNVQTVSCEPLESQIHWAPRQGFMLYGQLSQSQL